MQARTDSDQRHRAPNTTTWRGGTEERTVTTDDGTEVGRWENDGGGPAVMSDGEGRMGTDPPGVDHRHARDLRLESD